MLLMVLLWVGRRSNVQFRLFWQSSNFFLIWSTIVPLFPGEHHVFPSTCKVSAPWRLFAAEIPDPIAPTIISSKFEPTVPTSARFPPRQGNWSK